MLKQSLILSLIPSSAHLDLHIARVDDKEDSVHCERRLSDVGTDNHLAAALGSLVKDLGLKWRDGSGDRLQINL